MSCRGVDCLYGIQEGEESVLTLLGKGWAGGEGEGERLGWGWGWEDGDMCDDTQECD